MKGSSFHFLTLKGCKFIAFLGVFHRENIENYEERPFYTSPYFHLSDLPQVMSALEHILKNGGDPGFEKVVRLDRATFNCILVAFQPVFNGMIFRTQDGSAGKSRERRTSRPKRRRWNAYLSLGMVLFWMAHEPHHTAVALATNNTPGGISNYINNVLACLR